ncbi:MAG: phosphotransferase [Caldilineaceae bacterium]|nr:phosphotransferase [Caldilineaceae bacterium]
MAFSQQPDTIAALGPPLAHGRTATVYAWGDGQVLKLFVPDWSKGAVEYEADVARRAQTTGVPMPAVGDVVSLEGRLGIVYARVDGETLLQQFGARPWQALKIIRSLAELHADMHRRSAPSLPAQRQRLARRIRQPEQLPARLRGQALAALDSLPDGDRLCHGDFHPDNVLITANGPVIIDWVDATHGNPLADVARTYVLFRLAAGSESPPKRWWYKPLLDALSLYYLRRYRRLRPFAQGDFQRWLIPVLAARMDEHVPGEAGRIVETLERLCGREGI